METQWTPLRVIVFGAAAIGGVVLLAIAVITAFIYRGMGKRRAASSTTLKNGKAIRQVRRQPPACCCAAQLRVRLRPPDILFWV